MASMTHAAQLIRRGWQRRGTGWARKFGGCTLRIRDYRGEFGWVWEVYGSNGAWQTGGECRNLLTAASRAEAEGNVEESDHG